MYLDQSQPSSTETLAPHQKILLRAAELIEEFGWRQEAFGDKTRGMCAVGAIMEAGTELDFVHDREIMVATEDKLAEHLKLRYSLIPHVPAWNDMTGRTKEQVVATLREASAK